MTYNDEFKNSSLTKDERYYRRHKEKVADKNKRYHEENKDYLLVKKRANAKVYYEKHKEEINNKRRLKRRTI